MINNVEFDHADIYADFDAVTLAFRRLVNLVPRRGLLLIGADSEGAAALTGRAVSRVETFGLGAGVDWQAHDLESARPDHAIPCPARRLAVRRVRRAAGRRHNVRNALAAIAVATEVGLGVERIAAGLRSFAGVKRRLEVVGTASGVTIYDDFAHHPTAVAETLAGLRASNPDARIWAVFEPRSASSCRRVFQDDFARAFAGADEVLIAPVFRSTLPESERLSVPKLVRDLHARGSRRARRTRSTTSSAPSSASTVPGTSSSSCRTADSAGSTRNCCEHCLELRVAELAKSQVSRLKCAEVADLRPHT